MIEQEHQHRQEIASFTQQYQAFEGELRAYLFRLTANQEQAEDLCHDAFLRAYEKLETFAGQSSLKTWVFAIATNLARDQLRRAQRWSVDAQDICREKTFASTEIQECMMEIVQTSPQGQYEVKEHIDMCFTCMSKTLPIEEQMALLLKDVCGFTVKEIAQIVEVGEGRIKHALRDGRNTMVEIFDQKCSLVSKKGTCHQCSELEGIFNPKQADQQEALALKKASSQTTQEHLYQIRAELIRAIDPLNANGTDLHNYMLQLIAHPD